MNKAAHNSGLALCGHSGKMECGFPNKHLSCRQIRLRKPAQRQAANRYALTFAQLGVACVSVKRPDQSGRLL